MEQQQLFYDYNSAVITVALFVLILIANEIGFRVGRFVQDRTDAEVKSQTGAIQASILGLLALLLGFTFSMSLQRYDSRSQALITEANAIGTVILRVQLLPQQYRQPALNLLQNYVDLRISIGKMDLTQTQARQDMNQQIASLQDELWSMAVAATDEDPRGVTTGAFINSLNELIDSQSKRNALLQLHVPEVVLLLLFLVFIMSGGILGYSSGLAGKRVVAPTTMVSLLISMIVFIIIDLDRPKRGLIKVDQTSMIELTQLTQRALPIQAM